MIIYQERVIHRISTCGFHSLSTSCQQVYPQSLNSRNNNIHLKYILLNRIKHHWIIKRYTYSRGKWLLFHQKVYIWLISEAISEAISERIISSIYAMRDYFNINIPWENRLVMQSDILPLFDSIIFKLIIITGKYYR